MNKFTETLIHLLCGYTAEDYFKVVNTMVAVSKQNEITKQKLKQCKEEKEKLQAELDELSTFGKKSYVEVIHANHDIQTLIATLYYPNTRESNILVEKSLLKTKRTIVEDLLDSNLFEQHVETDPFTNINRITTRLRVVKP